MGVGTYFLLTFFWPEYALPISLLVTAGISVMLLVSLRIYSKVMKKRYERFEKAIISPIFYKTNGNITIGKSVVNSNIYFCEGGIVFASFEEKPYRMHELMLDNIDGFTYDKIHLSILTKDKEVFLFTISDVSRVIDELKKKGWITEGLRE